MASKILLIDGHSILNRAYYGLPLLTNDDGLHTNAVLGFLNIMLKVIDDEKPEYLTVAFDEHAPTFRHEMYAAYKGTRHPMPDELREALSSNYKFYLDLAEKGQKGPTAKQLRMMAAMKRIMGE